MTITILPLSIARLSYQDYDAVITIEDRYQDTVLRIPTADSKSLYMDDEGRITEGPFSRPSLIGPRQLILAFEDFDEESTAAASHGDITGALQFAREHEGGRLMVHCVKGQARSPAIALAILAERMGKGKEQEAVQELTRIRPDKPGDILGPNLHVLKLADEVLGRDGRLLGAWMEYERANWNDRRSQYRFWRKTATKIDANSGNAP